MKKEFIIYPNAKISKSNPAIKIIEAPLKVKLRAYITAYHEDYDQLPSAEKVRSIFPISEQDADIALVVYKPE